MLHGLSTASHDRRRGAPSLLLLHPLRHPGRCPPPATATPAATAAASGPTTHPADIKGQCEL